MRLSLHCIDAFCLFLFLLVTGLLGGVVVWRFVNSFQHRVTNHVRITLSHDAGVSWTEHAIANAGDPVQSLHIDVLNHDAGTVCVVFVDVDRQVWYAAGTPHAFTGDWDWAVVRVDQRVVAPPLAMSLAVLPDQAPAVVSLPVSHGDTVAVARPAPDNVNGSRSGSMWYSHQVAAPVTAPASTTTSGLRGVAAAVVGGMLVAAVVDDRDGKLVSFPLLCRRRRRRRRCCCCC